VPSAVVNSSVVIQFPSTRRPIGFPFLIPRG
jgi:hypothetical protein